MLRARSRIAAPWALIIAGWAHLLVVAVLAQFPFSTPPQTETVWVVQRISLEDSPVKKEEIPELIEYVQAVRETLPPDPDTRRIAARDQRANQSARVIVEVLESAGTPAPSNNTTAAGSNRFTDPVVELRQALGWGELDRASLTRNAEPTDDAQGFASASPSNDSLALSWEPAVNARGTALGRYIEQVERIISQRWQDSDLETDRRAIGIQGQVTLEYTVRKDGRVLVVQVARSSGVEALDDMARAALPRKLPRFPPELAQTQLHHQLVLRYRNPLVAGTKQGFRYDDALLQFGTGARLVPSESGTYP